MTVVYESKAGTLGTALILMAGGAVGGMALAGPIGAGIGAVVGLLGGLRLAKASQKDGGLQLVEGTMNAPTFPGGRLQVSLIPGARWSAAPTTQGGYLTISTPPVVGDNAPFWVSYDKAGGGQLIIPWVDGSIHHSTIIFFT